jgi:hypothetical protein
LGRVGHINRRKAAKFTGVFASFESPRKHHGIRAAGTAFVA